MNPRPHNQKHTNEESQRESDANLCKHLQMAICRPQIHNKRRASVITQHACDTRAQTPVLIQAGDIWRISVDSEALMNCRTIEFSSTSIFAILSQIVPCLLSFVSCLVVSYRRLFVGDRRSVATVPDVGVMVPSPGGKSGDILGP